MLPTDCSSLVADIYVRESDSRRRSRTGKDIRGASKSISEQEKDISRDIERIKAIPGEIFRDRDKGASTYSQGIRTEWERLIRKLESPERPAILACWECSRGTRDLEVYIALRAICRRTGVLWMYNGRLYDLADVSDAFVTGLDVLSAEREAGMTHDRVMRSARSRAAAGRPHGKMLYGYRRDYHPHTGEFVRQVPDEQKAEIVREIFRLAAEGQSSSKIARALTQQGVQTPQSARVWRSTTVGNLLRNPGYRGRRVSKAGHATIDDAWPEIIDDVTWRRVQRRLSSGDGRAPRLDTHVRHLLSGLIYCGVCEGKLMHNTGKTANGRFYPTYNCHDRSCVGRSAPKLEELVAEHVLAICEREDSVGATDTDDPRIGEAEAELDRLLTELTAWHEAIGPGGPSPIAVRAAERKYEPLIDAARRRLHALRARFAVPDTGSLTLREAWATPAERGGLSLMDRRQLISSTVRVTVLRASRGRGRFDPATVRIEPLD